MFETLAIYVLCYPVTDVSYTPQSINQSLAIPGGTPITLEQATVSMQQTLYYR